MKSINFLSIITDRFEQLQSQGQKTLEQLSNDDVHWVPDEESNSIAILVQHIHGNLISRFTDFLTTDGEKPSRRRDDEFIEQRHSVRDLMQMWNEGWNCLFDAIRPLTKEDLDREVLIRGESLTVMDALLRAFSHCAYHVGQIVYIGKHRKGAEWKTLSIPKKRQ